MTRWPTWRQLSDGLVIDTAAYSHPGSYAVNEDCADYAEATGTILLALADGLGGHDRGEVASRLAVGQALERFRERPSLDDLDAFAGAAHQALREADGGNLRSTLVLLVSDAQSARWAHVGDSRLYSFRGGRIRLRTRDHSVPELLHRTGEIAEHEIRRHPDRNRLLHTLGQDTRPKVVISERFPLEPGDAFLLCSDGWWENVSDEAMESALDAADTPEDWLRRMSEGIAATPQDPQDNYTAVAAFVTQAG